MAAPREREFTAPPIRLTIDSIEAEQDKLKELLRSCLTEEAAEQLIFLLSQATTEDFTNHCRDATKALGTMLTEHYGGEESFVDLAPEISYVDARSYAPLENFSYRGEHHSIGLLLVPGKRGNPDSAITIDLTYYSVAGTEGKKRPIFVMKVTGKAAEALRALTIHYGGAWEIEYVLNTATGTFQVLH